MKITTLISKRGLTLPQYRALTIASRTKVARIADRWRYRGGSRPLAPQVVAQLVARRLMEIDPTATPVIAVTTPAGCALLAELEGRR